MALVLCTGVDPVLMKTRQLILEKAGHTMISAFSEKELEKLCAEHQFDVVVLGQTTPPKIKCWAFLLIRKHCPSARVLELHALYSEPSVKEADAWLEMPIDDPEELADCVNALVQKKSSSS